jgi:hypothetical protein
MPSCDCGHSTYTADVLSCLTCPYREQSEQGVVSEQAWRRGEQISLEEWTREVRRRQGLKGT